MPELPEVETICRGLQKSVVGRFIESVDVRLSKIISVGPRTVSNIRTTTKKQAKKFENILSGKKIITIKRRAKMILVGLEGGHMITIHLKMSGQLIFVDKSEFPKQVRAFNNPRSGKLVLPHKYTHVVFNLKDGSRLYYNDIRQFGYIRLVHAEDIQKVRELQEYGPEPFDKFFNREYLVQKSAGRKVSVKQFLMDPKVVAGIGNIYSDEILFCAAINPKKKVSSIKEKDWKKIISCTHQILKKAIKLQGSSVGDFFKIDGGEGRFGQTHQVYGRAGEKCKKCKNIIKSVKLGGRTSCFCPKCQV